MTDNDDCSKNLPVDDGDILALTEDAPLEPLGRRVVDTGLLTRSIWRGALALAVARANCCQVWWHGPYLHFFGTERDTRDCQNLYELVESQVLNLAAGPCYGKGGRYRTDFVGGIVVAVRERLQHATLELRARMPGRRPVAAARVSLERRVDAEARRLGLVAKPGTGPRDPVAFDAGRRRGAAVVLERPVALPTIRRMEVA